MDDPQSPAAPAALRRASEPVRDAVAALLTAVGLVLLGAPAGLLWASVAPRVQVVLAEGGPGLLDPETRAFADADVAFGAVVLAVGVLCGLLALAPAARPYGPGVVVGLLLGGLAAAYVAAETGERVGLLEFREALGDEARRGTVEASLQLRAAEAVVLWPAGALAAFAVGTALRREQEPGAGRGQERPVSSG